MKHIDDARVIQIARGNMHEFLLNLRGAASPTYPDLLARGRSECRSEIAGELTALQAEIPDHRQPG
jgi:hypothetical protein